MNKQIQQPSTSFSLSPPQKIGVSNGKFIRWVTNAFYLTHDTFSLPDKSLKDSIHRGYQCEGGGTLKQTD